MARVSGAGPTVSVEDLVKRYPKSSVTPQVPSIPHIHPWICILVLCGALAVLMTIGTRGFYRRAID